MIERVGIDAFPSPRGGGSRSPSDEWGGDRAALSDATIARLMWDSGPREKPRAASYGSRDGSLIWESPASLSFLLPHSGDSFPARLADSQEITSCKGRAHKGPPLNEDLGRGRRGPRDRTAQTCTNRDGGATPCIPAPPCAPYPHVQRFQ